MYFYISSNKHNKHKLGCTNNKDLVSKKKTCQNKNYRLEMNRYTERKRW